MAKMIFFLKFVSYALKVKEVLHYFFQIILKNIKQMVKVVNVTFLSDLKWEL